MLSPPSQNGRPKPFLVAIQVVSASRLGGLKSHEVACAPTAPTQEYRKRGAGTRFAAIRSMSQHVISVTLNSTCKHLALQPPVSFSVVTLDSLLSFGGFGGFVVLWFCTFAVSWSPKRCLRLRHKERERARRGTDKGGR